MARRFSKSSGRKVKRAMREVQRGEPKSARSGKTVHSRGHAVAVGLSVARTRSGSGKGRPRYSSGAAVVAPTVRTPGKKGPGSRAPDEAEDAQGGFGPGIKSVR